MATFETLISDLLEAEGGATITNDPNDRGGLTKYGISQKAYPNVDVAALTEEEAIKLYKKDYWNKFKIGTLPEEYRRDIFFNVVNSGSSAIRDIQEALGISVDGVVGSQTRGALENFNGDLTRTIKEGQINRYISIAKNNPDQRKFLNGWINRAVGEDMFSARTEDLRDLSADEIRSKAMSALETQSNREIVTPDPATETYPQVDPMGFLDNLTAIMQERLRGPQRGSQTTSEANAQGTSQQAGSSRGRTEPEQPVEEPESQPSKDGAPSEQSSQEFTEAEESLIESAVGYTKESEPDEPEFTPAEIRLIERATGMPASRADTERRASGTTETEEPVRVEPTGGQDESKDPIFGIF